MRPIDIDNYEADLEAVVIDTLVDMLVAEARELRKVLPEAQAAQWQATPRVQAPSVGRPANDGPANPTADIALDGRRLALRAQVLRSERALRDAVITVRGVRRGLEKSLDQWDPGS